MAATSHKKYSKRKRSHQGNTRQKKWGSVSIMLVGVGILVLGLIASGMVQVLGFDSGQDTSAAAFRVGSRALQSSRLEERAGQQTAADAATNPETRYLGPASDPASLALAEQGELETPTLVWFHADW